MATDQEQPSSAAAKEERKKRRKRRWGNSGPEEAAPAPAAPAQPVVSAAPMDARAKALALQESVRAKLAALKAKKSSPKPAAAPASAAKRPAIEDAEIQKSSKKARVYDIDWDVTAPTFQTETDEAQAAFKDQKKAPPKVTNPYLSNAAGEEEEEAMDERLVRASKPRSRHKPMNFVEPGKFVEIAERKRQKAINAAESGFTSGRKASQYVAQSNMAQIYGQGTAGTEETSFSNRYAMPERAEHRYDHMPMVMEWWDMEMLPSKLKKAVAQQEGNALSQQTKAQLNQLGAASAGLSKEGDTPEKDVDKKEGATGDSISEESKLQDLRKSCFEKASLSYCKTAALVQHIVPIKPPYVDDSEEKVKPVLHLTQRELKRQRKLRRQDKQRELQDKQAAGLMAPPEPRLTLQNFMRVLGDQAYLDPSKMEQKVMEQIQGTPASSFGAQSYQQVDQRAKGRQKDFKNGSRCVEGEQGCFVLCARYVSSLPSCKS